MTEARRGRRVRRRPRAGPRQAGGPAVIYGWHAALAALRNPERRVTALLASEAALRRLRDVGMTSLPVQPSDDRALAQIAGPTAVHQGIAVVCEPLVEHHLTDLAEARLVIVLDQVTDPHNFGAIVRTAAAFGADAVITADRHAPPESGALAKVAAGGLEHVPIVRVPNLARALAWLGDAGFWRIGLDSAFAEPIEAVGDTRQLAIVLGAEGTGLRRLTAESCDVLVRLDLPGPIASLNVSNAAAIALYALTRRGPGASMHSQ